MKTVFITGATGYIGFHVAKAFRRSGYEVLGLARSEEKGRELIKHEITPVIGDLSRSERNSDLLKEQIEKANIVVHCAKEAKPHYLEADLHFIDLVMNAKNPSTFLYTSGCFSVGSSHIEITEESKLEPLELGKWRRECEKAILTRQSHVASMILRPGFVFGNGGGIFLKTVLQKHSEGIVIPEDGGNILSLIHINDLAKAYVLAAQNGSDKLLLNLNDGSRHTMAEIGATFAPLLQTSIRYVTAEEAKKHYLALYEGVAANQPISNKKARNVLNWVPSMPSLISTPHLYYQAATSN